MKKIVLYFTTLLLLFASCEKKPKVKPIDWENYNDVYTVVWNYKNKCRKAEKDKNKNIMASGWIQGYYNVGHDFYLSDKPDMKELRIVITLLPDDSINKALEIASKLDTCDLSKKCFIKGELLFYNKADNSRCATDPIIYLHDVNNIYFE